MAESKEELMSLLMKVKEESEKVGLKLNIHSKQCFIYIANVSMYYIFFTIKVQKIFKKKKKLKILQTRLKQYVNCELVDVQAGFRKGRGARGQVANVCWIIEKAREF